MCWCFKASATLGQLCTTFNTFRVWTKTTVGSLQSCTFVLLTLGASSIHSKVWWYTPFYSKNLQDVCLIQKSRCCRFVAILVLFLPQICKVHPASGSSKIFFTNPLTLDSRHVKWEHKSWVNRKNSLQDYQSETGLKFKTAGIEASAVSSCTCYQ